MVESGTYVRNEADDGWMPCCHKCGEPFSDGEIGDVKNYPYDGVIAVFFKCPKCGEESQFVYEPQKGEKTT